MTEESVAIVGGGPIGLALALHLDMYGVRSTVFNTETETRWHPKDNMFANTLTAGEQVKAGTIRAIGVATPQRSPVLPDVPPISDTVPGFYASSWWGIGAPRGTPGDVVKNSIPKPMPPLPSRRSRKGLPRWAPCSLAARRTIFAR